MKSKLNNIYEVFGCNRYGFSASTSLWQPFVYIGPEIETESWYSPLLSALQEKLKYWVITEDGSLRNKGKELKAMHPLGGKDILLAMKELAYIRNMTGKIQTHSVRTSNHYHINISDLDVKEVSNIILWSAVFEDILYSLGKIKYNRKNNPYCQSVSEQPGFIGLIDYIFHEEYLYFIQNFSNRIPKYCSFHINTQFGTIEYRTFDSTLSPTKNLLWINILSEFITKAKDIDFKDNIFKPLPELAERIWGRGYHYIQSFIPKKLPNVFLEYTGDLQFPLDLVDPNLYPTLYTNVFNFGKSSPIKRSSVIEKSTVLDSAMIQEALATLQAEPVELTNDNAEF